MNHLLIQYQQVAPTTWVYLSSLLMIGLFFKFNRFWSVRNLDLILLILLAPGLLLVNDGLQMESDALANSKIPVVPETKPADDASSLSPLPAVSPSIADGGETNGTNKEIETPSSKEAGNGEKGAPSADAERQPTRELSRDDKLIQELQEAYHLERMGYIWLFTVSGLLLLRLLLDPTMVRRPLLEPNLSMGGMIFIGCSLFVFLMANVIASTPTEEDLKGPRSAAQLLKREATEEKKADLHEHGPGYAVLNLLPVMPTITMIDTPTGRASNIAIEVVIAKIMAVFSHLLIVIGIVAIGYLHFDNLRMGTGAATMYLMLPYTAEMTGRVDHVLPAALLVWSILCYRRPLVTGIFIGLAMGTAYYPLFLLPLWLSFYWQRGVVRFTVGVVITLTVLALSLILISKDSADYWSHFQAMFGLWLPKGKNLSGIWNLGWDPVYRFPVLAAFVALSGTLAIWPAQKNLGTLLSCSAAVMVATQFWHGHGGAYGGGGTFMAWYLPLTLLTVFRPNLEDRIALSVLSEGWRLRRKTA